jgi:hypothetical protein
LFDVVATKVPEQIKLIFPRKSRAAIHDAQQSIPFRLRFHMPSLRISELSEPVKDQYRRTAIWAILGFLCGKDSFQELFCFREASQVLESYCETLQFVERLCISGSELGFERYSDDTKNQNLFSELFCS